MLKRSDTRNGGISISGKADVRGSVRKGKTTDRGTSSKNGTTEGLQLFAT
ncbi:MAG TPA: hypothetical protein VGE06_11890 [Flavisolibacter sp.]